MSYLKCQDCKPPKRKPGCHATCKDYQEWNEKHQEEKRKINKRKFLEHLGKK